MSSKNIIVEEILLIPGARVSLVIHVIRRGRGDERQVEGL